jgi:uncharacterized membrane protein SirB2
MTTFLLAYYIHIITVTLSGAFFLIRGVWMMMENPILQAKFVRVSPHIIDTLLLLSAIAMAVVTSQYPFVHDWLTVKLFALVAYIVLGVFALRRGKTKTIRFAFLIMAAAVFGFMVSVAMTRSPLGIFALL